MADLIDRQAAIEWFIHKENELFEKTSPRIRPTFANGIARALAKLPTVDAVEVVRCKDCKHYQDGAIFNDIKFCCRLKDKEGKTVRYNYSEDDYCSYGERRNNNA